MSDSQIIHIKEIQDLYTLIDKFKKLFSFNKSLLKHIY